MEPEKSKMDLIVGGRYRLVRKIGAGAFGEVYMAVDMRTGREVAAKLEKLSATQPLLMHEKEVYDRLQGGRSVPHIFWYGAEQEYRVLVMDLLGPSLEELLNKCNRHFSLRTVLLLADHMIARLEFLHEHHFVHRDIKADNFVIGNQAGQYRQVYLIDFGLAKQYRRKASHMYEHIPYSEGNGLTGTPRFCSMNAHRGVEQSRRDDMEALGYVLVYLFKGSLPWQNVSGVTKKQHSEKICECKTSWTPEQLCQGMPKEFVRYMGHVRSLKFEEAPGYSFLRTIFRLCWRSMDIGSAFNDENQKYDWTLYAEAAAANSKENAVGKYFHH